MSAKCQKRTSPDRCLPDAPLLVLISIKAIGEGLADRIHLLEGSACVQAKCPYLTKKSGVISERTGALLERKYRFR
jgi:hypothetical protein